MCRIAKGKGGSKCPGPVNKADTDFQLAMVYDIFTEGYETFQTSVRDFKSTRDF